MYNNHFKIAFRQILKRKGYSLLNIVGLAVGITSCLLILQYVLYERSYDQFQRDSADIYRLRLDCYQKDELAWQSATVYPAFAPTLKADFPEVVDACRLHDAEMVITNPETQVKFAEKKGYYADPSFLKMFGVQLLAGDAATALTGPNKIILSESMAKKYFGQTDVIGRRLEEKDPDLFQSYEVTGVFQDYPKNSHLILDYLLSYRTLGAEIQQTWNDTTNATETNWGWYDFYTYLQFKPNTDIDEFRAKLPDFTNQYINAPRKERNPDLSTLNEIDILPLSDIHLYSNVNQEAEPNGNGKAVSLLFLVAFFILTLAWVNYVNLATARSLERSREVGVRKVLGADRRQLVLQFLTESLLLNLTALLLALMMVQISLPIFQNVFEFPNSSLLWANPQFVLLAIVAFLTGAILSGMYPAFVLSGFRPVTVMKGLFKNTAQGAALRKGLIVFQFVTSIALIIGTMVVYKQLQFMRSQDLGVDIEQTLILKGPSSVLDSLYDGIFTPFKEEVLKMPNVQSMTSSAYVPGDEIYWTNGVKWVHPESNSFTIYTQGVDDDFLDAYQLGIVNGRNFSKEMGNENHACLLNEKAASLLGFPSPESAINEKVRRGGDTLTVVGVTKDFHHLGLQKAIDPVIFLYRPGSRSYLSLKVGTGDMQATVAEVQQKWEQHFPDDPFNYFFLDQFFDQQYQSDTMFGQLFTFFALLAIFVASLGLFGLASYDVLQRTKEIGIRKVLGATTAGLVTLLSKDFLKLVFLAFLVATPLAYFFMEKWLADFAYHTNIGWWVFVLAGVVAVTVAFLTVSFQSTKAALANPVKSLRSE
jgi:putative ABC transport system permease protein